MDQTLLRRLGLGRLFAGSVPSRCWLGMARVLGRYSQREERGDLVDELG